MRRFVTLTLALLFVTAAYSQSADVITEILDSKKATFGQACYISAVQQNLIEDDASFDDAIMVLKEEGQIPERVNSDDVIPMIDAVYIFSQMWDIKGGLMFTLTKGAPRYAFRQFQADGVISSTSDPSFALSGPSLLQLYTACVRQYGGFDITAVSMEE